MLSPIPYFLVKIDEGILNPKTCNSLATHPSPPSPAFLLFIPFDLYLHLGKTVFLFVRPSVLFTKTAFTRGCPFYYRFEYIAIQIQGLVMVPEMRVKTQDGE